MEARSSRDAEKGSRDNVPCGVKGRSSLVGFGATPQLFRGRPVCQTRSTKGAGSEASLPLTLRVRRRAPKLLIRPLAHCRAKWAQLTSIERRFRCWSFSLQGISRLRTRQGAFRSPLDPFGLNTSILDFIRCKGNELPPKKQKTHPDNPLVQERIAGMLAYHRITRTLPQMPQRTPGKTKYRTMQSCRSSP